MPAVPLIDCTAATSNPGLVGAAQRSVRRQRLTLRDEDKSAATWAVMLPPLFLLLGYLKNAPLYATAIGLLKVLVLAAGLLMVLGLISGARSELISLRSERGRIFFGCACLILFSICLIQLHGRFPEVAWWAGFLSFLAALYVGYFRFLRAQDSGTDV